MEIAQTIDEALYQYYTVERGIPVPNWKTDKNPQWWTTQIGRAHV